MSQMFKKAEIYLRDYFSGKLEEDAQRRKEEILYPPRRPLLKGQEQTTMVQSSPRRDKLEQEVLSYIEDGTYVFIRGQIRRIEKFLEHVRLVDEHDYNMLVCYYKHEETWVKTARKTNMSERTCRRKRDKWISELTRWI